MRAPLALNGLSKIETLNENPWQNIALNTI